LIRALWDRLDTAKTYCLETGRCHPRWIKADPPHDLVCHLRLRTMAGTCTDKSQGRRDSCEDPRIHIGSVGTIRNVCKVRWCALSPASRNSAGHQLPFSGPVRHPHFGV